jgi:hypothetical protein
MPTAPEAWSAAYGSALLEDELSHVNIGQPVYADGAVDDPNAFLAAFDASNGDLHSRYSRDAW